VNDRGRSLLSTLCVVAAVQGINITGFVMATELFPPRQRTIAAVSHEFLWALGGALLAGYAYLLRRWRPLQVVVSAPALLAVVLVWSVAAAVSSLVSVCAVA